MAGPYSGALTAAILDAPTFWSHEAINEMRRSSRLVGLSLLAAQWLRWAGKTSLSSLPPLPGFASPQPAYPSGDRPDWVAEYRSGFDIGSQDRGYGYPQDVGRAYQRFGRTDENAFREGYFDGYSRRPMQR